MPEAVRLVAWDLDETFWKGTLTEGGIAYNDETHNIVIELAKRGIMSTICSKNDLETVKKILVEKGIWDYFIFPSINWEPKGPRLAALVDTVQLRAGTLMLIDDNPMNLNEAKHFVEGIQVSDEKIIPQLLGHPLFKGKNDSELSRLKQYKLLERRKADEAVASSATGNNYDFLRTSNVRVILDHDIEKHIDRAVELVNRTNQLNFTKIRLPEDPEKARAELRKLISKTNTQAGLVRVIDNYGDYGFCGFYVLQRTAKGSELPQFCFSCRILNMGVEAWLYRHLGRPVLEVSGEVLSDPKDESIPADWVTLVESGTEGASTQTAAKRVSTVFMRGGCDLRALEHYLGQVSERVVDELNLVRDGLMIRIDHSLVLRHAIEGLDAETKADFCALGYDASDFSTQIFQKPPADACWIFSFWKDASLRIFRHKKSGKLITMVHAPGRDYAQKPVSEILERWKPLKHVGPQAGEAILRSLQDKFEFVGPLQDKVYRESMELIFSKLPVNGRAFVVLGSETLEGPINERRIRQNEITRKVASRYPNVTTLDMDRFVDPSEQQHHGDHFDRMAYFRLYEHIRNELSSSASAGARQEAPSRSEPAVPRKRKALAEAAPA